MDIVMVKPKKLAMVLSAVAVCLIAANIATQTILHFVGDNRVSESLDRLFNVSMEENIPTLFSVGLLLFCAFLLALIANAKRGQRWFLHWTVLAAMFFYLGVDEGTRIHERVGMFTGSKIEAHGFLYFAWVLPYGVLTAIAGFCYLKFLFHLPRRSALLFAVAGLTYVGGALGLEMIGARHLELNGAIREGLHSYAALYMAEELLEMTGCIIFGYALLRYMESELRYLRISWPPAQPQTAPLFEPARIHSGQTRHDSRRELASSR